jgi:transcriptional regulator with XRE-family HTH domain
LPSFEIALQLINIFQISFDYLLLNENCLYPRNIKLIKLGKKLDDLNDSNIKNNIETSTKAFLKENHNDKTEFKQDDNINIELSNSFHTNLKEVRKYNNIKQVDFAKELELSAPLIGMYEKKIYPAPDKLIKISKKLNISIHALATGKKLYFDFQDRPFGKTIFLADRFLPLEYQKFLIELMENLTPKSAQS